MVNCNNAVFDLINVGSYPGSPSPYGTFDQGGNVWQWNEAIKDGYYRGSRGGSFGNYQFYTSASERGFNDPPAEDSSIGFRLAMVPEPSTGLLVIAGLLGLAGWRRGSA